MIYKNTQVELEELTKHCVHENTKVFLEKLEGLIGFEKEIMVSGYPYYPCKKQDWIDRVSVHFHGDWYIIPNNMRLDLINVVTYSSITVAVYVLALNFSGWQYYIDGDRTGLSRIMNILEA